MHIGLVTSSVSRLAGGLFDATRLLARHLNQLPDTRVTVFGLADEFTRADLPAWGDCSVNYFTPYGPRALGWAPGLTGALQDADVDIAHQHGLFTLVSQAVNTWREHTGRPTVISPHGMLDTWALNNAAWKKKLFGLVVEKRNLHSASCLHALCLPEEEAIRDYGLTQAIEIVPNGVEIPPVPHADHGELKTLLYLGRLHEKKGITPLLEAWRRVQPAGWQLRVIGSGEPEYEHHLAQLACQASGVHLPGARYGADKTAEFAAADAFILPSHSEGLPIAALEAMAFGLPVLLTEACNLPEVFQKGAGVRISPAVADIEKGLRNLASMTRTERQAMGARGRSLARAVFQWEVIAPRMRAIYQRCLDGTH